MSFGRKFGQLIKKMRGIEGLTQQELAVKAFGEEASKSKISLLENGHVEEPHISTIDALVVALNISDAQMNGILKDNPHPSYVDNLTDLFDASKTGTLHAEIAVEQDGTVVFMHDCPMKADIKRLEYFKSERVLIWVTNMENRRSFGMPLDHSVAQYFENVETIDFYSIENGIKSATKTGTYPLKIID